MDLGLKGRVAIVCAASQGLGKATAVKKFGRIDVLVTNAGGARSCDRIPWLDESELRQRYYSKR